MTPADVRNAKNDAVADSVPVHRAKQSLVPRTFFWPVFGVLLLVAGVQVGLIVLAQVFKWSAIIQTHLLLAYWILVSAIIVWYIRRKIYVAYEIPLQEISAAMARIAQGDFSVRIHPLTHKGTANYFDAMILDVNKMVEDLGSIEMLKSDFIANVSHELKTPLSAMQNYAVLLRAPDLEESVRTEYAKAISLQCRRLTSLVSNILKLNRLENQYIFPKVPAYDVGEHVRECVLSFEQIWSQKNINLEADIADGIMVTTDGELLSLVWNNLLSNALKFTPEGGTIYVCVQKDEAARGIAVSVRDTGCGMDKKTQEHVFDKFFQGDTSHAKAGNGLGLALAFRAVTICGGRISVESEVEKGSCFTVWLPY